MNNELMRDIFIIKNNNFNAILAKLYLPICNKIFFTVVLQISTMLGLGLVLDHVSICDPIGWALVRPDSNRAQPDLT